MKRIGRYAHLGVTGLFLAGVVAQPFLIGLWLFGAVTNSDLHTGVGFLLFIPGAPLLLLTALLAWLPKRQMVLTLVVIVDTFLQVSLPGLRDSVPAISALHPLNAFVLLVLLWTLLRWDRELIAKMPEGIAVQPPVRA